MDIKAEEISKIIRDQIGSYAVDVDVAEVGTIVSVGDGIARVNGVENTMAGEITRIEGHIAKYMGVGMLAYFGWPRAHEDEAERCHALRARYWRCAGTP